MFFIIYIFSYSNEVEVSIASFNYSIGSYSTDQGRQLNNVVGKATLLLVLTYIEHSCDFASKKLDFHNLSCCGLFIWLNKLIVDGLKLIEGLQRG